jgi:FKBP-type peptidyl-prolyl cis-trans isomerase FkpA
MHNLKNVTLLIVATGLSGMLSACQASGSNGAAEPNATEMTTHDGQEAKDRELILEYLKTNGIKDAQETPSGLFYRVEKKGEGAAVQPGNMVRVHYTGRLLDGSKFDSSLDRGEPLQFPIGQGRVIPGWDEGIPLFAIGGKGTLYIPSGLAYGEREIPDLIPAHSVLVFDIEVVDAFDPAVAEAKARAESETTIQAYLKEKGLKAEKTESGLYYVVQSPGSGDKPANGQTVSVHYTGKFTNGEVFDSSVDRGEPITFPLGQGRVIRGWDEGLALFAPGGKGILIIPPHLGYGSAARGPIPANSVLVFDVELLSAE